MASNLKVLVLNGPNLNLLGVREPGIYGAQTMEEVVKNLQECADTLGMEITPVQTNFEGELLQYVQEADAKYNLVVVNPGALTHTSYALRDAIAGISTPVIEVHITNIYAREEWRNISVISSVCWGTIAGLGSIVYRLALEAGYNLYHNILSERDAENAETVPLVVPAGDAPNSLAVKPNEESASSEEVQRLVNQAQQYAEAAQRYAELAQAAQAVQPAPVQPAAVDIASLQPLMEQMQQYVAQAQGYAEQAQAAQAIQSAPATSASAQDEEVRQQFLQQVQKYVEQAQQCANQAQQCANQTQQCANQTQQCANQTQQCTNQTQQCANQAQQVVQTVAEREATNLGGAVDTVKGDAQQYLRSEERSSQFVRAKEQGRSRSSEEKSVRSATSGVFISEEELPTFTPTCNPKRYQASITPATGESEANAEQSGADASDLAVKSEQQVSDSVSERIQERMATDKVNTLEQPAAQPKKKKPVRLELMFGETKLSASRASDKGADPLVGARKHSSLELALGKEADHDVPPAEVAPEPVFIPAVAVSEDTGETQEGEISAEISSAIAEIMQDPPMLGDFSDLPGEFTSTDNTVPEIELPEDHVADLPGDDLLAAVESVVSDVAGINAASPEAAEAITATETAPAQLPADMSGSEESVLQEVSPAESTPPEEALPEESTRQTGRNKKGWRKKLGRLHENGGKKR